MQDSKPGCRRLLGSRKLSILCRMEIVGGIVLLLVVIGVVLGLLNLIARAIAERVPKRRITEQPAAAPLAGRKPNKALAGALGAVVCMLAFWVLVRAFTGEVKHSVASDAVAQYEIADREGGKMDKCVQAGLVKAAFLQAQDERTTHTGQRSRGWIVLLRVYPLRRSTQNTWDPKLASGYAAEAKVTRGGRTDRTTDALWKLPR